MAEIVYCEFLKLKRTRICLIAFWGTLVTPLLVFLLTLRHQLTDSESFVSLFNLYDDAFVFLLLLFAPLTFSIVAAYLFSREYTEKTLKTLFVVPISKKKFLVGKFITLLLCILLLMIFTWAELLILAIVWDILFGIQGLTWMGVLYFLIKMLYGGLLLYAVITPVAYSAVYSRGFFVPIFIAAVIALSNVILSGSPVAAFFPWTAAYLLVTNRMESAQGSPQTAFLIIGIVCFLSILGSIKQFEKRDVS